MALVVGGAAWSRDPPLPPCPSLPSLPTRELVESLGCDGLRHRPSSLGPPVTWVASPVGPQASGGGVSHCLMPRSSKTCLEGLREPLGSPENLCFWFEAQLCFWGLNIPWSVELPVLPMGCGGVTPWG